MATAQQLAFWQSVAPLAVSVASQVPGLYPQTLLVQWGDETGYNAAGDPPNNLAGISPGGRLAAYRSRAAFGRAYIVTIKSPLYASVRSAPDVVDQLYALGRSPWAAGHYASGGVDGQALVDIYQQNRGLMDSLAGSIPVAPPGGGPAIAIPTWVPVAVVAVPIGVLIVSDLRRL